MSKRLPPHVLNALRLRNELAALVSSRAQNGRTPPPMAGVVHVLARLAVVLARDGATLPSVKRMARELGAGDIPEGVVTPEVRRATSESKLGHEWHLPAADTLGVLLCVSEAERSRLGFRLIGAIDLSASDRRRAAERARKARKRAEAGMEARPRASQPWIELGVSRATYFRHKRKRLTMTDETAGQPSWMTVETPMSARLYNIIGSADTQVSIEDVKTSCGAAPDAPPSGRARRTFEPAPAAPPVASNGIRDRAMRSVILPHPRIIALLRAAQGPIRVPSLADQAHMRRDACRRALGEMAQAGLVLVEGDRAEVSPALAALR